MKTCLSLLVAPTSNLARPGLRTFQSDLEQFGVSTATSEKVSDGEKGSQVFGPPEVKKELPCPKPPGAVDPTKVKKELPCAPPPGAFDPTKVKKELPSQKKPGALGTYKKTKSTDSLPIEKVMETFMDEMGMTEPEDACGQQSSGAQSSSAGGSAGTLAELGPGAPNVEPGGADITQEAFPATQDVPDDRDPSNRERFLNATLICPGIALKKMKMAIADHSDKLIGVLGVSMLKKYRHERANLQNMVIGNPFDDSGDSSFWTKVAEHLKEKPVGALVLPSTSPYELADVLCHSGQLCIFSCAVGFHVNHS